MSESRQVRVGRGLYGGKFLTSDPHLTLPFVLRKETVEVSPEGDLLRVLEPAPERVTPRCPHFGTCGGCQYQMVGDQEQLTLKREILYNQLHEMGVDMPDDIPAHGAETYGYRNRIRLRVERLSEVLRFGYNIRSTTEFLPITTCPIATPILIETAEALLAIAASDRDAAYWLNATSEVELFCSEDLSRVQLTLFCAPRTKAPQGSLQRMMDTLRTTAPQVAGAAAVAFDPRTGPTGRTLAETGAPGLNYRVAIPDPPDEAYWITRGGFFQVNRFLIETLIQLVCFDQGQPRSGALAWDLYAGVGLFSRIFTRSFAHVTAVEANPSAAADLRASLAKLSPGTTTIESTTLDFLHTAVVQRERPEVIVLDPPRAGAGLEACALLARLAPATIVYVSCDPTTLARDLHALQSHYKIAALHLVDLFPQTFHIETVAILERLP
jgi:23S rRNA (uracil1939-C5)-methyltransferase